MGPEMRNIADDGARASDRSFGVVFCVVFVIVALLPVAHGGEARVWALIVAGIFGAVAAWVPTRLAPLNRLWTRFGLLLHKVVSPLVLGVLFFLVLTPTALLMRACGKHPLRLRFEREATTYWLARVPPGPTGASMKDPF